MAINKLNIIVGNRAERFPLLLQELSRQKIENYELWDGIYFRHSVKESINASHRQIVQFAKIADYDYVIIAEDDFVGTNENSWAYFIENMPSEYDLYLSMIYSGDEIINNRVKKFTGMTLFSCHKKFYDKFLNIDAKEHIDIALAGLGDYVVCKEFCFIQRNGWSSNTGKLEVYDSLLNGRKMYLG